MKKTSLLLIICFVFSCANFKKQVAKNTTETLTETTSALSHRFYLIGDAGGAKLGKSVFPLLSLQKRLQDAPENSTVLFLGDNIYHAGLPKKDDKDYELAKHRLQVQIDAVSDYKGQAIFIPGNHDYYNDGIKGLKREEYYVEKALGKKSFLPKNGCPITKVKLTDETVLIVIDSQWYLENWNDNPTMNDDCFIKTRHDFFLQFEALIKKNRTKTTIVAMHHPIATDGPHGGHFSAKQNLFPKKNVPLPILGNVVNQIRKTGGVSPQDLQNRNYRFLVNRLMTIAQNSKRVIFASGHEHSLQYLELNNLVQIVSGSGSKTTGVKRSNNSLFGYGALGYAILDVYKDGTTQVKFIKTETDKDEVVFTKDIYPAYEDKVLKTYPKISKDTQLAKVYDNSKATEKGGFYKFLWGDHYREEYGIDIPAPIANLDTLYGGLTPVKRGGGNQSVSLRLLDKDGRQWVMRALKKNAVQFLQINAFQQQYIKDDFKGTFFESFIEDIYTTTHPYASFIMPTLSKSVGVNHTRPELFFVPKQKALGAYNDDYGDALYMIEEHVGDTQMGRPNFGKPDDIVSSLELFSKLKKNHKHKIDEKVYIRARLFDMVLGDWDRHQDQWRWSKYEEGKQKIYRPIPRDRDQVFSNYDGALLSTLTGLIPPLRKMQTYKPEIRSVRWHNTNGRAVDVALLKSLSLEDWLQQADYIKTHLTDEVIDEAFSYFPKEVQSEKLNTVKETLKHRRNTVEAIAKEYYTILNKAIILTATNKGDNILITRLDDGKTNIQFSNKKTTYFDVTYDKKITKEIWLYALDGEDKITVKGKGNKCIKIRIIGGQNNDKFIVENGKGIVVYDFKSKKNDVSEAKKARVRLLDNYETNTYNYYKRKTVVSQTLPAFGINKDDGLFIGFNNTMTFNNLRQNPFSHRHNLVANYFITNDGFNVTYLGNYGNIISSRTRIQLGLHHNNPNYANNFFGYGNETINPEEQLDLEFNRIKLAQTSASLGISREGRQGGELSWMALYESNKIDNTPNRFIGLIADIDASILERKNFIGTELNYRFRNYNNLAYPTLGMDFQLTAGYKVNTDETERNFTYFKPALECIQPVTKNKRLVFANKTQAQLIFGDGFEFYQAATLGANTGLRAFRFQRFTGKQAVANSSDLRFNLRRFQSGFAPLNLGLFTSFDIGRVWVDNDTSERWHNSYGGGLWLKMAETITANLGAFNTSEDLRIVFGMGFRM